MLRRFTALCAFSCFLTGPVFAQGLTTKATKDDWEEINFEFNMSVLTDGYPSLLRIAELLGANPDYKVKVTGHTDWVGSHPFNNRLGLARANAVKSFLERYGAKAGQVTVDSQGKASPTAANQSKEGRWMNRRVVLTVTDKTGKVVGAGGAGSAVNALEALAKKQEDCCNEILKRLDKLDDILNMLRDLKNENAKLRGDMDALKAAADKAHAAAQQVAAARPGGLAGTPGAGVAGVGGAAGGPGAAGAGSQAGRGGTDGGSGSKFSMMGLNLGPTGDGNFTATGRGQYFNPVSKNTAIQAQGEFLYFQDRKEGQADIGLVNRWKDVQLGTFMSFKGVSINKFQNTGTLGQAAFTFDYLFGEGRAGAFVTKSFLNNSVVNRSYPSRNLLVEQYLSVVDQVGASGAFNLGKRAWIEGNLGLLRSATSTNRPGGTARLVFPVNRHFAFTAEGGVNETLLTSDTNGRAVFGILFGNFLSPREYKAADHPVPVDVPRIRYEVLTRTTRTGNDPPVADAGPDQVGVAAGTIQLDGSASFDPDGDPITFQWTQIAGPAVALTGANAAKASFAATEGNVYGFRLLVKDDKGAQGIARVSITTRATPRVRVLRFTANPTLIRTGQESTLNWLVENADTVTISGVTQQLNPGTGSVAVSPAVTTSYTLTARNRVSEDTAVVTVLVEQPQPRILRFTATPATILQGEASTLNWQTENADSVELPGIGTFAPNGSVVVTPQQTQAYTLIARNRFGETTGATVVTVQTAPQGGPKPTVINFEANPTEIIEGDSSTLSWNVQDADEVSISGIGTVQASGSSTVNPTQTTTYTLTAKNKFGTTTATARVTVYPKVRILSFTGTPTTIKSGQPVTYQWSTQNATEVFISEGIGPRALSGSLVNAGPVRTTTITLTALGRLGQVATASVTITVDTTTTPGPNRPPVAAIVAGGDRVTAFRDLILDASPSSDPDNDQLTYSWKVIYGEADILTPTAVRTQVTLKQFGDWIFEVTVTDAAGVSSKARQRITFVNYRPVP